MQPRYRIAYLAHAIRSDWNNGNAHFLRGLMRALVALGHDVTLFEPEDGWSIANLREEPNGQQSLQQFEATYPELSILSYRTDEAGFWTNALRGIDFVFLHEWNSPALARQLLGLRDTLKFRLLFHDTHHRASSSPEQIRLFGLDRFDGIVAFGEALRQIYLRRFNLNRVWTLHEAADTTVFRPPPADERRREVVWVGNWGDNERTAEIETYFIHPAACFGKGTFTAYGVRYPREAQAALREAGIRYGGYLPNLEGPHTYAAARATVHIPRQAYTAAMTGIPTIRVFEALACGIPLVSAPWSDSESLFRPGDYWPVASAQEASAAFETLLSDSKAAEEQARRGLETILARHTCMHRAEQLTCICEETLR